MKDTDPATATVMVVDDAPDNLELLNSVLSQQGYRVLEFPCAELALQAVAQAPPDLILLDIMMPDMDGFAMCQRLKTDARLQAIPVLFISAMNDLDHKLRAFSEGGVDYVTKPFQKEEVAARVATQLELYRVQRELQQHRQHLHKRWSNNAPLICKQNGCACSMRWMRCRPVRGNGSSTTR